MLKLEKLSSNEDRGQTDRATALPRLYALDIDLWPWLLIPGELWSWATYTQIQVQRLVGSKDRVETDGQTDRQTYAIDCLAFAALKVTQVVDSNTVIQIKRGYDFLLVICNNRVSTYDCYRCITTYLAFVVIHCDAVAQRLERWTCDQQVMGSNPARGKSCV